LVCPALFALLVPQIAIFDIDEEIRISVTARWDVQPENPDQVVEAIIKASNGDDSIITALPLVNALPVAEYKGNLAAGTLRQLFSDPFDHFEHWGWGYEELTVYPRKAGCKKDTHRGPEDHARIGVYLFSVEQITFTGDQDLCREDPSSIPPQTELITPPHWDSTGKNEPVCYIRNEKIGMNIRIRANHTPNHLLQVQYQALPSDNNLNFITAPDTFQLNHDYFLDIDSVSSVGNLSDSIGYDSLTYAWQFTVSALRGPRTGTVSGPHVIYRIFDKPIQSHTEVYPINVNACLEQVCKEYAQDQDSIPIILERTSAGINGEGYTYDPGRGYYDIPIQLYRQRIGLCADFAMYMTAMMHSIGIPINCRTLLSGEEESDSTRMDYWINSYYGTNYPPIDTFPDLLWTVRDIGGSWPDGAYSFTYHMVTHYAFTDTAGTHHLIFDPVFNINYRWESWYAREFRYYYNIGCDPTEPPSTSPGFYDWSASTIPTSRPTPKWGTFKRIFHSNCIHP